jgi:hypothetical protein
MSGIVQVHVLKRAGPAIAPLISAAKHGIRDDLVDELITGLSKLDDEATEYVLTKCLSVVTVKRDGGWPKILASVDRLEFMYDEIGDDAYLMLAIAVRVMGFNFEPLFREALSSLSDGAIQISLR